MAQLRLDRIESLIKNGKWTSAELADACGVSYNYIYRLRNGKWQDISGTTLAVLAHAIGTSVDYLVDLTDDARPVPHVLGTDDEIREMIDELQQIPPDERRPIRQIINQLARANTVRIIGRSEESSPDG